MSGIRRTLSARRIGDAASVAAALAAANTSELAGDLRRQLRRSARVKAARVEIGGHADLGQTARLVAVHGGRNADENAAIKIRPLSKQIRTESNKTSAFAITYATRRKNSSALTSSNDLMLKSGGPSGTAKARASSSD